MERIDTLNVITAVSKARVSLFPFLLKLHLRESVNCSDR